MEGPKDEHALSKLRTEQLLCIRSIPSYVESSEMFLALVPPLQNASTTTTATLPVGSATVGAHAVRACRYVLLVAPRSWFPIADC